MNGRDKKTFEQTKRARLLFVYVVLVLFFAAFVVRAIRYQVVDRDIIKAQVETQLTRKIPIRAMRGQILDRNGKVLAFSRDTYDIELSHESHQVDTEMLEKIQKVYPKANMEDMTDRMKKSSNRYVTIMEDLPVEVAETIGKVDYSKVGVIKRFKRVYPNGELAAKVLGTVSNDGYGVMGVEEQFNSQLSGVDGYIETETDLLGRRNPFSEAIEVKEKNGVDIELTIDSAIQHFVYNIIRQKRAEFEAKDIIAIVQDSKSGEILAMCSTYSFDPNNPQEITDERLKEEYDNAETDEKKSEVLLKMWSDPIVSTNYEPGSVMKVVTSMVAIDENLVSSNTPFLCGGVTYIDGEPVRCLTFPGSHGPLDFKHGFMFSCNVVYSELSQRIDKNIFYKYLENLGLLDKMNIGLTSTGQPVYIEKDQVYNIDYAKMSFGHAISVTPLHIANVAFTISNDGNLIQPSIIKKVGNKDWPKKNMGKVCTPQTSAVIREYMKETAELYPDFHSIKGFSSGVKTGTSVKIVDGKYDDNTVCTSIVHLSPIRDPKINVIVIVDEPQTNKSSVNTAGSIARDISDECLRYLKVSPDIEDGNEFKKVPDFKGLSIEEAENLANSKGIKLELDGTQKRSESTALKVKNQDPEAGSLIADDTTVYVLLEEYVSEE